MMRFRACSQRRRPVCGCNIQLLSAFAYPCADVFAYAEVLKPEEISYHAPMADAASEKQLVLFTPSEAGTLHLFR